jgi:pyruvate formate lyase activating enzyme
VAANEVNIFDLHRFSWHDGPGIRTVVFFKGCNMRCFWCQNPESQLSSRDIFYYSEKCINCGNCVDVCPEQCHSISSSGGHIFERTKCVKCGKCEEVCFSESLRIAGKKVDHGSVIEEIVKDIEFYRMSGGGVTLSGGEPLLQPDSCFEIMRFCRQEKIGTALDTSGNVEWSAFQQLLPVTDYILFDIKTLDEDLHHQACGVTNRKILYNLKKLLNSSVKLIIRVPVVPGVNDNADTVESIAEMVRGYKNVEKIELLPFHKIGGPKYKALGREYRACGLVNPGLEKISVLKKIIDSV